MKQLFHRFCCLILCLAALLLLCTAATAVEGSATDLRKQLTITGNGYSSFRFLTNGDLTDYAKSSGSCTLPVESPEANISSLYLLFNLEYGEYTVTDNGSGATLTGGANGFLHEYLDLAAAFGGPVQSVTLSFQNGIVRLSEICAFTEGVLPDFVQQWELPLDSSADILLLSSHGDDDQLFFAGLFPLYAAERGYQVQVVYMTDHRNSTYKRTHEMLNGMWQTGVKYYPVFGAFEDFLKSSMKETYARYRQLGHSKEELLGFVGEQIRRFKPQVIIAHDINGEYGHGMHMVYTDLMIQALDIVNDATAYPELAEQYGLWEVSKAYIHLYEENPIVIDYDVPLEAFDGMTAFNATQTYGYPCHESQQYTWFTGWLHGKSEKITKATQIVTYNPAHFGLYYSTVGEDVRKNDFMENITSYAELRRIEEERLEAERLEQERLEAERLEAERLEQARLEKERLEAERLEKERLEAERLEKERLEAEEKARNDQAAARQRMMKLILLLCGMTVCVVGFIIVIASASKNKRGKYSK